METLEKKQTRKIGVSGSFINQLMCNNSSLPEVGKGATRLSYSDRHCYEVIEVSKDGKTVKLEALDAVHDKTKEGGMGHQNWILNPTGRFTTIVWRHGAWRTKGQVVEFVKEFYDEIDSIADPVKRKQVRDVMIKPLFDTETNLLKLVEGKTKLKTTYNKMNILFGVKDYYYDWEF